MMINRDPIKKSTVASAMALYGTLGGLLLNCKRGNILYLINTQTAFYSSVSFHTQILNWTGKFSLTHNVQQLM